MPNASRAQFNETDLTFSPGDVPVGISSVIGKFKRGAINDPKVIVNSWNQFVKLFGGYDSNSDDAFLAKRALDRGSALRVCNIRHYTDITNPATLTAIKASPATGKSSKLDAPLVINNLYAITINTIVVSQVFTVSSDNTQQLLAAKIKTQLPGIVSKAVYLGNNLILITPVTGINLVVTGAVTLGVSQANVTIASVNTIVSSDNTVLFTLAPKYANADGSNLEVQILSASNGDANSFDLAINHLIESSLNESYKNIKIIGNPSVASSTYLKALQTSNWMDVTYADLSGTVGQQRPVNTILKYDTGSDGANITDSDILGDSSNKLGVYSLDPYDDFFQVASLNSNSNAVMIALANYATSRQDHVAFLHIDNSNTTEADVAAARDATFIDTTYAAFFAGGIKAIDSANDGAERDISEIGDVLGAAAYSASKFGPWWSFAGTKRGTIINCLGIVNNFGLAANYANRNLLANHQICIVGQNKGKNYISGNFTAQIDNSTLSFLNVRRMLIYLKKLLAPIFEGYIEDPNDPTTWKQIFNKVKPQLKKLKDQRGIADWDYQGDQFITDVSKCVVNDPTDVQNGKYLVILYVKDIVSLQDIQVNITLTDSGVSFEDSLSGIINTN